VSTSGQPVWAPARVVESRPVATAVRRITVERPPSRRAAPGSHLDVRVRIGDRWDTRSYSIVESSADGSRLTISVQLAAASRGGSAYLHTLAVGDEIETTQPLQNFPLRVGAPRYVLLAGGIGVTALVDMARVLASLGADYRLVYVGRSREVMAYADDLASLHADRLALHVDDEGTPLDVDALVASIAADTAAADTELYMCGPIRLMDAVRRAWHLADLPPTNLRYETFGNSGWFDAEPFVVRLPELGIETTVGTDTTVLDALTAAGADLMYDCRKGECGLCLVDVAAVDGHLDHRDVFLSSAQQEAGSRICLCVSRVASRPGAAGPGVLELSLP
jgi:vanillate O-demethylase ferredoxin subunit